MDDPFFIPNGGGRSIEIISPILYPIKCPTRSITQYKLMMPTKCLLACAEERLLGSIVEDLLNQSDDLVCSEIISGSHKEIAQAIELQKPDVLIFCHKTHNTVPIQFAQLFLNYPEMLIIIVSSDDNYMHIYGRQRVMISQSGDLLSAIQNQ